MELKKNSTAGVPTCLFILLTALFFIATLAEAGGYPWDDHDDPFDFLFGNQFDTHQQSKINGGKNKLTGFLYIEFTGGTTDGLPNAEHGTDTAGWVLDGFPVEGAVLIEHNPGEHPLWCIDPEDLPRSKGYTHFHWEGTANFDQVKIYDGYLLKLTAIDSFYFVHGSSSTAVTPGIDYISHENIEIDEFDDDCGLLE